MLGTPGLRAIALVALRALAVAQDLPSVVTITHSTCYDPAIATVPFSLVGNTTSAANSGTVTASFTTVLPDGRTEIVYDRVYIVTAADGSVSTVTEPLATSTIDSFSTSSFTTILPDGSVSTVTDPLSTSTIAPFPTTSPALSSSLSLGQFDTVTTQLTTVLPDGTSEVIYGRLYLTTAADGSVATTTEPFSTSILTPLSTDAYGYTTSQYTTLLPDGQTEVIFDRLHVSTASDGSLSTVTEPVSTSLVPNLPTSLTPLISTTTVISVVEDPTTTILTETSFVPTTIDGTPTTVLTTSILSTTYTASQTVTETSLVPQVSISGFPCAVDNCMAAVNALAGDLNTIYLDCAAFQTTIVTPALEYTTTTEPATTIETDIVSTDSTTTTIITTSYLPYDPIGQSAAGIPKRQADTNPSNTIPSYATAYCTAPSQYASVCACIGIPATIYTLPTQTISSTSISWTTTSTAITTSTTTSTSTTTYQTATPTPFLFLESGHQVGYVHVDASGALYLSSDASTAEPFFLGDDNVPRSFKNPVLQWVDRYIPNTATSDNTLYLEELDASVNYALTCEYTARNVGDFWGGCMSTGMPNGNPNVYGFGTCPNEGGYLYQDPNASNVKCYDGGTSFIGFFLEAYTPPGTDTDGGQSDADGGYVPDQGNDSGDSAPLTG